MTRGFYLMARGWMDHPALATNEPFSRREAWLWLIENAAFRETRIDVLGRTVPVLRGQICRSYRDLAREWGWSLSVVQRFIARLQTDTLISTANDTGRLTITLCNYDKYQRQNPVSDTEQETPRGTAPVRGGYAGGTQKKEGNEGKEDTGSLRSPAVAGAPAGPRERGGQASLSLGQDPANVIDFRDQAERVRQQLWSEGKAIMRRLAPAMDPKRVGSLIGQLAKQHGKGMRGGAKAIQVLRDVEVSIAAGGVAGYAIAETDGARAKAVETYLLGAVHRADGARADQPAASAPPKQGAYAQALSEREAIRARAYAAAGRGAPMPSPFGPSIDGELA